MPVDVEYRIAGETPTAAVRRVEAIASEFPGDDRIVIEVTHSRPDLPSRVAIGRKVDATNPLLLAAIDHILGPYLRPPAAST